ncbi:MAG: FmdE family protein [Candidatus Sulfobium sp.]|jgi:formylmethanofuran dehydrogenase subunit E
MKTYDEVTEFHGHSCPGLALGYRVALRALKEWGKHAADEEVVAIVENNSCAVDAVQVMTGCTFGKGNLIFRDYGKQVYTFISRPSGRRIRISVDWKRPEETTQEKAMWDKYMKGERSARVVKFVHDRRSARIRHILEADEKELMKTKRGKEKLPPEAEVYNSIRCESCGEKMMEPRARIKDGKIVCIPCFEEK